MGIPAAAYVLQLSIPVIPRVVAESTFFALDAATSRSMTNSND